MGSNTAWASLPIEVRQHIRAYALEDSLRGVRDLVHKLSRTINILISTSYAVALNDLLYRLQQLQRYLSITRTGLAESQAFLRDEAKRAYAAAGVDVVRKFGHWTSGWMLCLNEGCRRCSLGQPLTRAYDEIAQAMRDLRSAEDVTREGIKQLEWLMVGRGDLYPGIDCSDDDLVLDERAAKVVQHIAELDLKRSHRGGHSCGHDCSRTVDIVMSAG